MINHKKNSTCYQKTYHVLVAHSSCVKKCAPPTGRSRMRDEEGRSEIVQRAVVIIEETCKIPHYSDLILSSLGNKSHRHILEEEKDMVYIR